MNAFIVYVFTVALSLVLALDHLCLALEFRLAPTLRFERLPGELPFLGIFNYKVALLQ